MTDTNPQALAGLPALAAQVATATLRHGVTVLGALLVREGLLTNSQTTEFQDVAAGMAIAGLGLAWSYLSKFLARRRLKAAIAAPPPT